MESHDERVGKLKKNVIFIFKYLYLELLCQTILTIPGSVGIKSWRDPGTWLRSSVRSRNVDDATAILIMCGYALPAISGLQCQLVRSIACQWWGGAGLALLGSIVRREWNIGIDCVTSIGRCLPICVCECI
jgi:hypothetical protein